ncbi:MAG TPA: histone deacetylase [Deltaproteobacteria bacterium]|nr:MAG: hypothetical protein A2048_07240 [Deltaproteobacteria bacterium GWA2_45_12]HBF13877.1 histone deacetylase [Deltaproteobacteria bacterium]
MNRIGIIWDERYLKHETGESHPESPARLLAIKEILDKDSTLVRLKPRMASVEEIAWVHNPDLIAQVEKTRSMAHAYFDLDTPVSSGSADAAFLAAGGVLSAVQSVDKGEVDGAFAFPRPPGHHAEAAHAMGFCLFNNIAIAAEFLLKQSHKTKVAIVDIDVHHGNGTQHAFEERSDVFFTSIHRFPFYPGTGSASERGRGKGVGFTLNVPMPAYSDDADYEREFENKIIPAVLNYKPDFILVSAGFDAHIRDPLGGMKITKTGFFSMARHLVKTAKKVCDGKIVFVLEGGYDKKGLQEGTEAVLENL